MTRTKAGLAAAALLLVTACTSTAEVSPTSTLPILPPSGSINAEFAAKLSSEAAEASSRAAVSTALTTIPLSSPSTVPGTDSSTASTLSSESGTGFDSSVGEGTFTVLVADSIPETERALAQQAAELTRDSLILTDLLNRDLSRSDLDGYLDDYYYGHLLTERGETVQSSRANGRTQSGWFSGTITVTEASRDAIWIDACLNTSSVQIFDASGVEFPSDINLVRAQVGLADYDVGLRISHLVFEPVNGETC